MSVRKLASLALALSITLSALANVVRVDAAVPSDDTPAELKAFAKKPWKVESYAYGDLTGKKTNDAAMILVKGLKDPDGASGSADGRKLVVALRGADKKLHTTAESEKAAPDANYINATPPEIEISKNSISISQGGGANERTQYGWQYKLIDGEFRLIGHTSESFDAVADKPHDATTDANLLTGYVISTLTEGEPDSGKAIKSLKLYEVLSVNGAPPSTGNYTTATTPYISLRDKSNVQKHAELWHGANDLSAAIRSYHDGLKTLYVQVDVTDDKVTPGDSVALLTEKGKKIEPVSHVRSDRQGGYRETMQFDMTKEPFKKALGSSKAGDATVLPFTVEVTDDDGDGKAAKSISTAVSALNTSKHGGILLMPTNGRYTVGNVDAGNAQPALLVLPQFETP